MRPLLLALVLVLPVGLTACAGPRPGTAQAEDGPVYECPMRCKLPGHTEPYTQRGPGDCPVCKMHLAPQPALRR